MSYAGAMQVIHVLVCGKYAFSGFSSIFSSIGKYESPTSADRRVKHVLYLLSSYEGLGGACHPSCQKYHTFSAELKSRLLEWIGCLNVSKLSWN